MKDALFKVELLVPFRLAILDPIDIVERGATKFSFKMVKIEEEQTLQQFLRGRRLIRILVCKDGDMLAHAYSTSVTYFEE